MKKLDSIKDYPLYEKHPEYIKTPSGRSVDEINMKNILEGELTSDDLRISAETLEYQAQIQESFGNPQIAENFRRAAEMTKISDQRIIEIYNCMRPYVSTKEELLAIACELETAHSAPRNAGLVREAAEVYEKQGMLKR